MLALTPPFPKPGETLFITLMSFLDLSSSLPCGVVVLVFVDATVVLVKAPLMFALTMLRAGAGCRLEVLFFLYPHSPNLILYARIL